VNIPEKIRIGSSDYSVLLTDENLVCNGQESYGWINYNYHLIKINKNIQDKQGQEKTLLHELIHGIVRERSLDVANSNEEIIVEEIAMGLHQVIRDNPNMFKE
jgi:Zn-dependent peptidase ImmA (M78 family)